MTDDFAGRDMNADELGGERPGTQETGAFSKYADRDMDADDLGEWPDEEPGEQRLHAAPDWLRLWSGKPRPRIKTKKE